VLYLSYALPGDRVVAINVWVRYRAERVNSERELEECGL
jgi:hypothetical protein